MRVVMIKGFSKTGKTSTVTSLVSELRRRGYSVGTVKHVHFEGFEVDAPGTDTYKHMEAGAHRVTAKGSSQTGIYINRQMTIHEILKYYKEDFVILEGDCGLKCPTIITGRTEDDVQARMCPEAVAVSGLISESQTECCGLPVINGITEVKKLADLVEKKTSVEEMDVELFVGGKEIGLVPFVQKTLKNVVVGAIKALDGYEEGEEIVIRIK